jgi:protein-disulfide isomerase
MTAFNACFDGSKYTDLVKRETDDGRSRGVKATPTFFIGGQKYEGLLSATQFGQIITALAR